MGSTAGAATKAGTMDDGDHAYACCNLNDPARAAKTKRMLKGEITVAPALRATARAASHHTARTPAPIRPIRTDPVTDPATDPL